MARILLGVTGGIAAYKALEFVRLATAGGHAVRVIQTRSSQRFVGGASFAGLTGAPVLVDEHDPDPLRGAFPGDVGPTHAPVSHLELVFNADVFLVAPASANTLAKLAHGLADNCLTCVCRAWDPERPIVLAPAMNTLMWQHPQTRRHLMLLGSDAGAPEEKHAGADEAVAWINRSCPRLRILQPESKRLACGDVGVGGLAEPAAIVDAVRALLP
jgi:phosphopantothenoylcysteine decarboxylase/phosphopantothenate--cysteine ligase